MRRLIWIIPLAAVLLYVAVLSPASAPDKMAAPNPASPLAGAQNFQAGNAFDQAMKATTMQTDLQATAMLHQTVTQQQMRKLLQQITSTSGIKNSGSRHMNSTSAADTSASTDRLIARFLKQHPDVELLLLVTSSDTIEYGADGKRQQTNRISSDEGLSKQLADAIDAIKHGKFHTTVPSVSEDAPHVVAVTDTTNSNTGMIAIVHNRLLTEVRRHQERNLRLVPFPEEGRFRTESVQAGTLREMTVKSGADNKNASHYYEHEVVVRFREQPDEQQMKSIRKKADVQTEHKLGQTYVFRSASLSTEELLTYFNNTWHPEYAEPHYLYVTNSGDFETWSDASPPIVPNDALYSSYQWNLPIIDTELGWNQSRGSEDVVVAVLDTGVQLDHPDLAGKLTEGINLIDTSRAPADDVGHGTHVAGIVSANVNNGEGVAGVSWYNKIMPIKVLDGSGAGTTYSVAQGIIWATDNGAKVINMSLGNYASAEFLHDAIKYAYERDVILIAASGNDNTNRPGYPAAYPEVLAVGATDANGNRAPFSNYGSYIDVTAPGASIASTYTGGQYAALSGTSMASPHAAALAALIRTKNPALTNVEVMDILRGTANDLGPSGLDEEFGYGQINVAGALSASGKTTASADQSDKLSPFMRILTRTIGRFVHLPH